MSLNKLSFAVLLLGVIFAWWKHQQIVSPFSYPDILSWAETGTFINFNGKAIFSHVTSIATHHNKHSLPDLLLIHGYPASSYDFKALVTHLEDNINSNNLNVNRIITFDFVGFGLSDKPNDFDYSVESQCDQLEYILSYYNVNNCHILAHDLGDTVVQEFLHRKYRKIVLSAVMNAKVATNDAKILSIVFTNGGLFPALHRPLLMQQLLLNKYTRPVVRNMMNRISFDKSLDKTWGKNVKLNDKILNEMYSLINYKNGVYSVCETIEYINQRKENEENWVNILKIVNNPNNKELHVPMLLINGILDPISGAHVADMFEQTLPQPKVIRLENVGHWPIIESPIQVAKYATQFIQNN